MRVFISYRRADLGGHAEMLVGRIMDRLAAEFGGANIFLDIHSIPAGEDFAEYIENQIAHATAVLVIIGPNWVAEMQARSERNDDFVRIEIQAALERGTHLIPILAGDARMPKSDEVPTALAKLRRKNALPLDLGRDFHSDLDQLIETLKSLPISTVVNYENLQATIEDDNEGNILKYQLHKNNRLLSYRNVIEHWIDDELFRKFYLSLIANARFAAYVWETPPITLNCLDRPFEFVLLNAPNTSGIPDRRTYSDYFDSKGGDYGVVTFENLGKDALLVVPSPVNSEVNYSDLAAFTKDAPSCQNHALWRTVGRCIKQRLHQQPLWVSIAGGGIAWLHVRLDSRPKYYRYAPYRVAPRHNLPDAAAR